MSSYWEQTQKLKRRRRLWWTITAILTVVITAFYFSRRPWPEPRSLEQATEDRLRLSALGQVDEVPTIEAQSPVVDSTEVDPSPPITAPVPEPENRAPVIAESGSGESPESDQASNQIPVDTVTTATNEESVAEDADVAEEAAKELKRLREVIDRARKAYQAELARQDQTLLEEFGEQEWAAVRQQVELAEAAKQPQAAVERFNTATTLLKKAIPVVRTRQTIASLDSKEYRTAFGQLRQLRQSFPDHAGLEEIHDRIANLPAEIWRELADEEAELAAPDDPGFAEMWLVVANADEVQGHASEARESVRRAWEAIERMSKPERAVESGIDLIDYLRIKSDTEGLEDRFTTVISISDAVSDGIQRSEYLADLAGLAKALGNQRLYEETLAMSLESCNPRKERRNNNADIMRCRALSWASEPSEILAICQTLPKYNGSRGFTPFELNAMGYAYAALAAARKHDRTAFALAALHAESQLACVNTQQNVYQVARLILARADIEDRQWERAVISGRNLTDPEWQGSVFFSVMAGAPQLLDVDAVETALKRQPDSRYAVSGVAALTLHRLRQGASPAELIEWIDLLPRSSLKVAAFSAFAQARQVGLPDQSEANSKQASAEAVIKLDPEDFRSLVEAAEETTRRIEDPLQRAYSWQLIAQTWNLAEKEASYQRACSEVKLACRDAWTSMWNSQPAPRRGIGAKNWYTNRADYSFDRSRRDQENETAAVVRICECLVSLAELQVQLGDGDHAIETCIDAARASHVCIGAVAKRGFFLRMQAVLSKAEHQTRIPSRTLNLDLYIRDLTYPACLLAAWSDDATGLKKLLPTLEQERPFGREKDNQVSRISAELALLMAKQGDVTAYRTARRKSLSLIDTKGLQSEIKLLLAEADARAGEFVLAENTLVRKPLIWYGPADRPSSAIIAGLATVGRWEDAAKKLNCVSPRLVDTGRIKKNPFRRS
ncbi:MAG: hypothetical protein O2945_22125, partial [Planctomycetota bacterium]|nr:hypothetical protein [Planctomycetota bacterium]